MSSEIELQVGAQLAGRFRLIRRKADDLSLVEDTGWVNNMILNTGMNQIGVAAYGTHCQVGASSTPPSEEQTGLLSPVAFTRSITTTTAGRRTDAPYFGWTRQTFRFAAGVAAGTIAEVGVGWGTVSAIQGLFSRALVLDLDGNPSPLTVLSDEILDVVYELRMYPDLSDKVFNATIGDVEHACILRAMQVASNVNWSPNMGEGITPKNYPQAYTGMIGTVLGAPSGTQDRSDYTLQAYVLNSYERAIRLVWSVDRGNFPTGIASMSFIVGNGGAWQQSFVPPIAKENTATLALTVKVVWGRYVP